MCPWMKLQHTGSYVFGGSLLDLATIGAAATADQNEIKTDMSTEDRTRYHMTKVRKKLLTL